MRNAFIYHFRLSSTGKIFDPRNVWLYEKIRLHGKLNDDNDDDDYMYNPFTMDSVKQRVLVLDKPHKFPPHLWKKVLIMMLKQTLGL